MGKDKKRDILKDDLMVLGICLGVLVITWKLGKSSGYKVGHADGIMVGALDTYARVLG